MSKSVRGCALPSGARGETIHESDFERCTTSLRRRAPICRATIGTISSAARKPKRRSNAIAWRSMSLAFRPRVLNDVTKSMRVRSWADIACAFRWCCRRSDRFRYSKPAAAQRLREAADAFGTMMILSSACAAGFRNGRARQRSGAESVPAVSDWRSRLDGRPHRTRDRSPVMQGFCLTVDTAVYSRRERDISKRLGFRRQVAKLGAKAISTHQAAMTWETVAHIKRKFGIPLWLKGINRADDARRAVDHGVDVVYVSNHGGRQLDHGRGCIDALPEVVEAVDGSGADTRRRRLHARHRYHQGSRAWRNGGRYRPARSAGDGCRRRAGGDAHARTAGSRNAHQRWRC